MESDFEAEVEQMSENDATDAQSEQDNELSDMTGIYLSYLRVHYIYISFELTILQL